MSSKDLTIKYITKEFDVSKPTVYRWLSGKNKPHPAMQKALFKALERETECAYKDTNLSIDDYLEVAEGYRYFSSGEARIICALADEVKRLR